MIEFFQNGGMPMWFILAFGIAGLLGAVLFARNPVEHHLGAIRAISWATAFTSIAGFIAGLAATTSACAQLPPDKADIWHRYALQGFAESSSNLIFGASFLALTWLVVAVGLRRMATR
jgi:hypothetical protein